MPPLLQSHIKDSGLRQRIGGHTEGESRQPHLEKTILCWARHPCHPDGPCPSAPPTESIPAPEGPSSLQKPTLYTRKRNLSLSGDAIGEQGQRLLWLLAGDSAVSIRVKHGEDLSAKKGCGQIRTENRLWCSCRACSLSLFCARVHACEYLYFGAVGFEQEPGA